MECFEKKVGHDRYMSIFKAFGAYLWIIKKTETSNKTIGLMVYLQICIVDVYYKKYLRKFYLLHSLWISWMTIGVVSGSAKKIFNFLYEYDQSRFYE